MFSLAILIGIYSYLIFALGLVGFLTRQNILFTTIIFLLTILWVKKDVFQQPRLIFYQTKVKSFLRNKLSLVLLGIIVVQSLVNLSGALGPELGFDALWYHLTLPKLYLLNQQIFHVPGNLLYYSDMPKLTEMLYTSALALGNEITAKLIHFSFGILCLIALYQLARKFFKQKLALLVLVIFYANLVVSWQSITAYVDLSRTFFELMTLWGFLNWLENKEQKWLIESGVMLGLAIATKLLAFGSLFIFSGLIIISWFYQKKSVPALIFNLACYWLIALLVVSPWLIFSFVHTGNPVFPLFTITKANFSLSQLLNPWHFLTTFWQLFTHAADPISPVYLIIFPLVIIYFKKLTLNLKIITYYSLLALLVWYLTPNTGGGRYILPYLPAFSLLSVTLIQTLNKERVIQFLLLAIIILIALTSITYRAVANFKYLPVVFGKETKAQFLTKQLNFTFGDFYDTDNYFAKHLKPTDRVLLYGFHNLYYLDFPFLDSSWVKKGDEFNYIATQNITLPARFSYWNLIYFNNKTFVRLYSLGGQKWVY